MTDEQVEETIEALEVYAHEIAKRMGLDTVTFRYGYFLYLIETIVKSLPPESQAQFSLEVEELINAAK